jgi:hypothetical protein
LLLFDEDVSERVSPLLNEIKSLGIQPKLLDKEQLGQIGTLPLKKPDFNPASNKPGDIGCIFYTRYEMMWSECCATTDKYDNQWNDRVSKGGDFHSWKMVVRW